MTALIEGSIGQIKNQELVAILLEDYLSLNVQIELRVLVPLEYRNDVLIVSRDDNKLPLANLTDEQGLKFYRVPYTQILKDISEFIILEVTLSYRNRASLESSPFIIKEVLYPHKVKLLRETEELLQLRKPTMRGPLIDGSMILYTNKGLVIENCPMTYNTESKTYLKDGIEEDWLILKNYKPLRYRYWNLGREVTLSEYLEYINQRRALVVSSNVLLPELMGITADYAVSSKSK